MSEEGGGHGVGLWYISFSDMITLLLSFFVMLATFSTYDKESRDKFRGVMKCIANSSLFSNREFRDSLVPPVDHKMDPAERGSETPTDLVEEALHPQATPWIDSTDVFQDRKSFYIPSRRLFTGRSATLTPEGRGLLARLAELVRKVPCQVIIAEISPQPQGLLGARLERTWTLREFLAGEGKLPSASLHISAATTASGTLGRQLGDEPFVEISLIKENLHK